METKKRLKQFVTSASLAAQGLGFSLLGSFIALKGDPDSISTIAAILGILTGATYFTAMLAYWKHCRVASRTKPDQVTTYVRLEIKRAALLNHLSNLPITELYTLRQPPGY